MSIPNSGVCLQCKQVVEHRSIVKHLKKCLEKDATKIDSEKEKIFLISVHDTFKEALEIVKSELISKLPGNPWINKISEELDVITN